MFCRDVSVNASWRAAAAALTLSNPWIFCQFVPETSSNSQWSPLLPLGKPEAPRIWPLT